MRLLHVFLFASALTACATCEGVDDAVGDRLGQPQHMTIAAHDAKISVHGAIRRSDGVHGGTADLGLRGGHVVVHLDRDPDGRDRLVLDELHLACDDVLLPPAYFPERQVLTGILARLEQPLIIPAVRASDGVVWAPGKTDLRLDWELLIDGELVPLGAQTLTEIDVEVVVSGDDDGALRADVALFRSGVMWSWLGDVLTLAELVVVVDASPGID
jgi:hypothetical protein